MEDSLCFLTPKVAFWISLRFDGEPESSIGGNEPKTSCRFTILSLAGIVLDSITSTLSPKLGSNSELCEPIIHSKPHTKIVRPTTAGGLDRRLDNMSAIST